MDSEKTVNPNEVEVGGTKLPLWLFLGAYVLKLAKNLYWMNYYLYKQLCFSLNHIQEKSERNKLYQKWRRSLWGFSVFGFV